MPSGAYCVFRLPPGNKADIARVHKEELSMNYDDFLERIGRDLTEALSPKYGSMEIRPTEVEKIDGRSYKGLSVGRPGDDLRFTTNLSSSYNEIMLGRSYASVLSRTISETQRRLDQMPSIDKKLLTSYERLKSNIVMEFAGLTYDRKLLQRVPHTDMADMSIIYRVFLGAGPGGAMTALITNKQLDALGVTPEQLHRDAMVSSPQLMPPLLRPMDQVLAEMSGTDELPPPGPPFYVASTLDKHVGAVVIAYPGFLDQAVSEVGSQFFILPSSRHEVLLLADTGEFSSAVLREMVMAINQQEVMPEDRLSDNIYHYDGIARIFETADSFEERSRSGVSMEKLSVLQDLA